MHGRSSLSEEQREAAVALSEVVYDSVRLLNEDSTTRIADRAAGAPQYALA